MVDRSGQPVTHRRVLMIAVPIVVSNVTVPILGVVDTGVIGQLGEAAPIGAVGIGAIITSALYWFFGFLRMGTTGMTAQAVGARNDAEVRALLMRSLLAGCAAGGLLIAFQWPVFWVSFQISPASPEVETLAQTYLGIRIYGAPATIATYGIVGWLIATERTRSVLVLQVWMNGLNILLDLWFVLGLDWGVAGVAAASAIAEWTAFGLGLWLTRSAFRHNYWKNWERILDRGRLRSMVAVNRDIMIRSVLLEIVLVSFMFRGAAFDDQILAANQILVQFLFVMAYALDGFAFAAESLVGQAFGARDRSAFRRSAVLTSFWGMIIVIGLVAALLPYGSLLVAMMTTSEEVRAATRTFLPWMVVLPICGTGAWMLDGIFIGATRTRDLRNMMGVSFCVYIAAVLILLQPFDNHGLWAALSLFFLARTLTLGVRYPSLEREIDRSRLQRPAHSR